MADPGRTGGANAPIPVRGRITIRDVAREAGVSVGTASRALNRAGRVSERAIAAVTKAARRLGYEPDTVARSLRTGSTGVIGLLVSDLANPLYARVITAVEATLQAAGYALLIANTHNDGQREKALIDLFRRRRVDGLILAPCETETPDRLESLARELPVIVLDRDIGKTGTGVHVDHREGALQATRYLLGLGHTRIALLTPASALRPGRERIAGFREAFRERRLKPSARLIRAEKSAMEFAFGEALSLLSASEPPTAFLCLGTRILSGVLHALRQSGLRVPADASVVSIGDTDLSQLFNPAITALTWDLDAVGQALAQLLLGRLGAAQPRQPQEPQEPQESQRIVIATRLVQRESCAALATQARSR